MKQPNTREIAREAKRLVRIVAPMMSPSSPEVLLEVLGELMARFVACHHPDVRAEVRLDLIEAMDHMTPGVVEAMIKDGAPEEWRSPTMQ